VRARYYISFDSSTWTEFFPTNSPKILWKVIPDVIFKRYAVDKFRIGRTKNTNLYDTLYQRFFDPAYYGDDIYYKINVLGTDKFFFIDPITSGKIDTQNSVYESTPDTDDEYRDILALYEKKYQDRLHKFKLKGWEVKKVWKMESGYMALGIESRVFRILRTDLRLPIYLSKTEMPETGGETETVGADAISLLALEKIIRSVIQSS
jgi:hypothetical protein